MRVFVAGAAGAIGRRLVPQLIAAGHHVTGTTRNHEKLGVLRNLGADAVPVDGLDATAVGEAVARAEPDAIIHQMTALASATSMRNFDTVFAVTNELRTRGTDNLLAAATASGVRRFVAASFTGWPNIRAGGPVKTEGDPLDPNPPAAQRASLGAIEYLERAVTSAPLETVVLRYGMFYGPGTSDEITDMIRRRRMPVVGSGDGIWSMIHIDDAASATVAALERGRGIFNIVDDDPARAGDLLPALAKLLGAKAPMRLPVWLARPLAGEVGVSLLTTVRGSSNAKARAELDWQPRWSSWRDGFRAGLGGTTVTGLGSARG
ncbi:MAG: NAD-dependent epimerase/dehydratase family protein [Mycobacteriales bacterium]